MGTLGEDAALHGAPAAFGLVFFECAQVIQTAQKAQVADLLVHLKGVGDAAGPEGVSNLGYFASEVADERGMGACKKWGILGRADGTWANIC